jgi:hypothetical protein
MKMRVGLSICAAIAAAMVPAVALADDSRDPSLRDAAARAHDSDVTRQLNLDERAMVRARDARQMQGWRASPDGDSYEAADSEYAAHAQDHDRAMTDYGRDRARYAQDMAEWHLAVAACRAGDYAACGN